MRLIEDFKLTFGNSFWMPIAFVFGILGLLILLNFISNTSLIPENDNQIISKTPKTIYDMLRLK